MPDGFFTIEQWMHAKPNTKPQWVAVQHLNSERSLTEAMQEIERRAQPGLFRVIQTQRMIWAEKVDGKLRLKKWHVGSPEALDRTAQAFERDKGKWPSTERRRNPK